MRVKGPIGFIPPWQRQSNGLVSPIGGHNSFFANNYCIDLDGSNQDVSPGNISDMDIAHDDAFSLSIWFKSSTSATASLVSKISGTPNGWELQLVGSLSRIYCYLTNTNNTNEIQVRWRYSDGGIDAFDGAWHHVLWTYDGSADASGVTLYWNGTSRTLTVDSNTLSATTANGSPVIMGGALNAASPARDFTGRLDECAFWNRELSSVEATTVYNNGSCGDLTTLSPLHWYRFDGDSGTTVIDHGSAGDDATIYGGGVLTADAPP